MDPKAHVTSIDAVHQFRAELRRYEEKVRDTLDQMLKEAQRAVDWVESDRGRYWPSEMRKAENRLASARSDLERAKLAKRSNESKDCYDEQLFVDRAKSRLRLSEDKIRVVRHWRHLLRQNADELEGKLARLTQYLEVDLPKALASLDRMTRALDKYAEMRSSELGSSQAGSSQTGSSAAGPSPQTRTGE